MRLAPILWLLAALLVGAYAVDFAQRMTSSDIVAVGFAEGGDDAYYFFTVARNLAHGHGLTIDGTHWTTGFQPLWVPICALAFLAPTDRAALAIIYLISAALWLTGAWLFVRLIHRASATPPRALGTALLAVLFLGEAQLTMGYFNGMETGLYITLLLALLVAFQDYLGLWPQQVSLRRVAGLGVLAGLTMLARNDAFFLCGALLAVTLFAGKRQHPLRDVLIIGAIASALVLPWIAYCQWASGNPLPQSGIATSVGVRGHVPLQSIARKIVLSLEPMGFLKVRSLLDDHLAVAIVFTIVVAAVLVLIWRRARPPIVVAPSGWVLLCLAASNAFMLLYYPLGSAAGQFFERYFTPLKLMVFILIGLLIVRGLARIERKLVGQALVLAVALATVGSHLYWIARDYGRPWRSHLGPEAYEIVRSPYAIGTSRIGMAEFGRLGFLYPTRVVNLDGKMNVDALRALLSGTLNDYIRSANLDYIMLHEEDVRYFDDTIPAWRKDWRPHGMLAEFHVFERGS